MVIACNALVVVRVIRGQRLQLDQSQAISRGGERGSLGDFLQDSERKAFGSGGGEELSMCGSLNSLYDLEVPGSSQCECLCL